MKPLISNRPPSQRKKTNMNLFQLKKFCDPERHDAIVVNPFTMKGYTYATNGHILVRVEGNLIEGNEQTITTPRMDGKGGEVLTALPPFPKHKILHCAACNGIGTFTKTECNNCYDGQVTLEDSKGNNYTAECQECEGEGTIDDPGGEPTDCEECEGSGVARVSVMDWGGDTGDKNWNGGISYANHIKLSLLKDVKIAQAWALDFHQPHVYFTFKGGDGFVMMHRISKYKPF